MEYRKIINFLGKENTQPWVNWVKINEDARGMYNINSQIKFKTTMLNSNLCIYSDAYILAKVTKTITGAGADPAASQADERNKQPTFKKFASFT